MRVALLAGVGLIGVAAYVAARVADAPGEAADSAAADDSAGGLVSASADVLTAADDVLNSIIPVRLLMWSADKVPVQYRAAIAAAESANGIPAGMLARLLYQESRFRPEIIDGRKVSPAGALGIAQFMPATAAEWGIDPLNPAQAIDGAGRYLAWLYKRTGAWPLALAAYNWGIGNVLKKGIAAAPLETRNYFGQIMADIGLGGSQNA